jgi:hypothetical protein
MQRSQLKAVLAEVLPVCGSEGEPEAEMNESGGGSWRQAPRCPLVAARGGGES